ncbi:cupin-like domain-containing protein [Paraglaciecola sp. L1A13]|uniref:cupin-like domain-containing protein n=1 Tax=Paraglaciecola sp. L1A13 TaxID=2686359 RepID=UPI00131D5FEF|nr:cupin-like domain-containing protein [Paraglaciecola sp. L1A13]|tara:strand:+ start:335 stop:1366 length:1032 start_codon:yes stop_codon:yes gene_type:complete
MSTSKNNVIVLEGITPHSIPYDELFSMAQPVILKGLVKDWPLVKAGKSSSDNVMGLLEQHYSQRPTVVYKGPAAINARFGYNSSCTGFNFTSEPGTIPDVFAAIRAQLAREQHDYFYINSLRLDEGFPTLSQTHQLTFNHAEFNNNQPVAKIWLGTESVAAAHFDQPKNIACCVLGKRRFTLFPPEQVHNLYPGPLTPTPGGQVVTLANLGTPDFARFPRLKTALENAYIADLEPGDALYYPNMWWHEVEAFDRFNAMVNFWWMTAAPYLGNPMDALMHAMMSVRDRSNREKEAWKALFDYYIFADSEQVLEHLPPESHGLLATMDDNQARRLRAMLRNNLNR